MRILILSTSDGIGGAGIAARRLMNALAGAGYDVRMLVRDRVTDDPRVATVRDTDGILDRMRAGMSKPIDRLRTFAANGFSSDRLWLTDAAAFGCRVTGHPWFQQADVIHLHWVQQGFMSIREIDRVLHSGKRIVWTMHDLWPATSVCHYPSDCVRYHTAPDDYGGGCHHCPQLCRPASRDISASVFRRKMRMMADARVTFVACSRWLAAEAAKSSLLAGQEIVAIPNAIDTDLFTPKDNKHSDVVGTSECQRILFSSANVSDERKGVRYLVEACSLLADLADRTEVVVLGQGSEAIAAQLPFRVVTAPYTQSWEEIAQLNASVDIFVIPSLQDNLPNTIMEAMACGVPCVGFRTGGIPEMIDHQVNGYVAEQRDAHDLACGIRIALQHRHEWGQAARQKVLATYAPTVIVPQYAALYAEAKNA